MNKKIFSLPGVLVVLLYIQTAHAGTGNFNNKNFFGNKNLPVSDTTVGTKTSDSTGNVIISNGSIQQDIISNVPELSGITVSNEQSALMVNTVFSYLIFKGTKGNGDHVTVAVGLTLSGSTFTFQAHNGRSIHVCNGGLNCSSCTFVKMGNTILTCNCEGLNNGNQSLVCMYSASWLH